MTVLAVDKQGRPVRSRYRLLRCERVDGDKRGPLIPAGNTIIATAEQGLTWIRLDGSPTPHPQQDVLRTVIQLANDGPTDDAIWGTERPRAVGESWAIHKEAIRSVLAREQIEVPEGGIRGTVSLLSAKGATEAGQVRLRVAGSLTVDNLSVPSRRPMSLQKARGEVTFSGLFPAQEDGLPYELITTRWVEMEFKGKPRPSMKKETTVTHREERRLLRRWTDVRLPDAP